MLGEAADGGSMPPADDDHDHLAPEEDRQSDGTISVCPTVVSATALSASTPLSAKSTAWAALQGPVHEDIIWWPQINTVLGAQIASTPGPIISEVSSSEHAPVASEQELRKRATAIGTALTGGMAVMTPSGPALEKIATGAATRRPPSLAAAEAPPPPPHGGLTAMTPSGT